ncbi:virulence-associated protein E [Acetobacterium fimetarium]|uniref:Virulence-associated protein E n=1 Tax=Acetobacterium fimetarium TaxID=52691 RepID=A0ABR6WVB9_9FIRM|nr:virulence-associated E family protein [Acetobacterium fimetarium]MBC3804573.1 virulence-associated protein E [Acetobacterium fimetarium]
MINDKKLKISTAGSRKATTWITQELYWSEFVEKIRNPVRSAETLQQYLGYNKGAQDDLKDVGGFVGGQLSQNRRKNENVVDRSLITLDMDNIPSEGTTSILQCLGSQNFAYAVYSTRKHEPVKPRLRIVMPLDQPCSADEYEPIARKLASILGIEFCDPTTFEASRLMYWPSCCSDSQYIFHYSDSPFLSKDGLLSLYTDWKDVSQWPTVPGELQNHEKRAKKQENPRNKKGVVGAFCKVYNVETAIAAFLPDKYTQTDLPDRYTFAEGSTTGGAIIYEGGDFLFSHHATDPCSGKLVNAFDLVRLHKFGDQDNEAAPGTPVNKLPSYKAMCEFAVADQAVTGLIDRERYEQVVEDFAGVNIDVAAGDLDWMRQLEKVSTTGLPTKTVDNVLIILENDPRLKGKLAFDEFANRVLAMGALPWDERPERRAWSDPDDSAIYHYLEKTHKIKVSDRDMKAAMTICSRRHKFNDVKDYLTGLTWDGIKRLDTLLIDYFGAEDNIYTRAVMRKSLAAAVARTMFPGTKFDCMLVLGGLQGIGKSTFFRLLGRKWYSDSLQTFEGKEASEMIQGIWINELGELASMNRSEINAVKLFLSRTEDIYREPYGRRTGIYPRRCVFFGTTNDTEYLRDTTGNRRFWPVDLGITDSTKNVFTDLDGEVDQIWAEAYVAWQLGERLYLTGDVEAMAKEIQEDHKESNPKEGMIIEFLKKKVPPNWDKRSLSERRMFWASEQMQSGCELVERDRVCAAEIWCECLGGDPKQMKRQDSKEINNILSGIKGLKKHKSTQRFGKLYGIQKGFVVCKP